MFATLDRFIRNIRRGDQSLASGLLIGLLAWTLTHLVGTVASNGTIEYTVNYANDELVATHQHVYRISVKVSNLSHDTPVPQLEVSIQNPHATDQATFYPKETACTFDAPSWAGSAVCDGEDDGGDLLVPMLVPGTSVGIDMKYTGTITPPNRPIVRIRPGPSVTNVRVIQPGIETFLARHETGILFGLLVAAAILFLLNVSTPKGTNPSP